MERHVNLLGILLQISGALAMLVGLSMLLLSVGALVQLLDPAGPGVSIAAGLTASAFAVIGMFALLFGGVHIWTAFLLRRRHPFGRVLALVLGVIDLVWLPFGTALGIYALWSLLKDEGRRLFEPLTPAAAR